MTLWTLTYEALRGPMIGADDENAKRGADAAIFALANDPPAAVLAEQRDTAADNAYWNNPRVHVHSASVCTRQHGPIDLREYYAAVSRQYRELRYNTGERVIGSIRDLARVAFAMVKAPYGVNVLSAPTDAECDYVYDLYVDSI